MKTFDKKEYNKLCADFLGISTDVNENQINTLYQCAISLYHLNKGTLEEKDFIECFLFDSDWNWIMEVVDKIESLDVRNYVELVRKTAVVRIPNQVLFAKYFKENQSKKEAIVQAIWEFLSWYYENNQNTK